MPQFTSSQNAAADTWGKDVLVAAGAGSGKTTVLAERIIRRIKAGADISDFLVVTFTVASAADLREKIGKRLSELCAEMPEEPRFRKQLFMLYSASIGTISSICLKQVKQSAALLGLPARSHIGDEALCKAMLTECAESVLSEFCESDTERSALLLDNFASFKNDNGLIAAMCKLYESLRSFPFYKRWLENRKTLSVKEAETVAEGSFFESRDGASVRKTLTELLDSAIKATETMDATAENDKQAEFAAKVGGIVRSIRAAIDEGYEQFCEAASLVPSLRCPNKPCAEYKANYETAYADCIKKLPFYCRSKEELAAEYKRIAAVTEALTAILLKLDAEFEAAKRSAELLDFADAEHLFLKLLVTETEAGLVKTSVCHTLSARYSDIFIDEYQDVSPLQDMIFAILGEGKRFMVGDAKQSIYGFRDAYPDIFIGYRDGFADVDENGKNARVFLNENFRCDKNVIEFCNHIFRRIYTVENAGSDYTKEALIMGKEESGDEKMCVAVFENRLADNDDEFEYIAAEVLKLCEAGVPPSDIAVLSRKSASLTRTAAVLERLGVPYTAKSKTPLLKAPEVMLAVALLRTVDNPTDDISLAAVLRSPLFGFTAEELVRIRKGDTSLYADLCRTAKAQCLRNRRFTMKKAAFAAEKITVTPRPMRRVANPLAEKCKAFLDTLEGFRDKALLLPAHSLLMHIYEETGILAHATEGNEDSFMANLYALYDLTKAVESNAYKGLSVITEYISRLAETGQSPAAADRSAEGAVSLLTMHASKGLEFPYVFLCGTGKQIFKSEAKTSVTADFNGGISFNIASQKEASRTETLHKASLDSAERKRALAEDLRLLYVAFTRAKRKLFVTVSSKRALEDFEKYPVQKAVLQADLFMDALLDGGESFNLIRFGEEDSVFAEGAYRPAQTAQTETDIPPLEEPEASVGVTAKYFVSATRRGENGLLEMTEEKLMTDRVPVFAAEGGGIGAEVGTANHAFMQFASFAAAEKDVEAEAARLFERGFITKEQHSLLRFDMLGAFFRSEIYAALKASPRVYREKRFSTRLDGALFSGGGDDGVLVQGVIDCFFENPDGSFTLLDYKTDAAKAGDEELLIRRHGTQLFLYAKYINKLTGKPVSKAYIYSFALGKAIECEEGKTE